MSWLALDVGGANLKAADGLGYASSRPFALWRDPHRLSSELELLIAKAPACTRIAVTMTGELADCFETKAAGVRHIVNAVGQATRGKEIRVYLTDGKLVAADQAFNQPLLAAASNWHALAAFANRFVATWPALLIDMGSTTTDIIPLKQLGPRPTATADTQRLITGELVYMGVQRTPIHAIVPHLMWRGQACPVAAELFATVGDAHVLLGNLPEDAADIDTADGRPRTRAAAHARLARVICSDATMFSIEDAEGAALEVQAAQVNALRCAVLKVAAGLPSPPQTLMASGQGEFLLNKLAALLPWRLQVKSLSHLLGPMVSQCAPAHALAVLARERFAMETAE